MAQIKVRQNNLGINGWFWSGNYKLERYLYTLHRITGLGILLYLILHLMATTVFRVQGKEVWESMMGLLHNPWFKAGEYIVCVGFLFHMVNGLRLTLQELGFLLGRPKPPVYPYKDSLRKKRPWTIAMVVVVVILSLLFLFDFIAGGGNA
jgi:succinate dehydrogenase / fumarate reductase cytochrome b subunit